MAVPFAIIAGVGPGTGAAVSRKFATAYPVALLARKSENYESLVKEINGNGGKAIGVSTDVSDAQSVKDAISKIGKEFGDVGCAAAIFNASGSFVRKPFLDLTEQEFVAGYNVSGYVDGGNFNDIVAKLTRNRNVAKVPFCSPKPHSPCCSKPNQRQNIRPPSSIPVPLPVSKVQHTCRPSPPVSGLCALWPKAWPANLRRKVSMLHMRSLTVSLIFQERRLGCKINLQRRRLVRKE